MWIAYCNKPTEREAKLMAGRLLVFHTATKVRKGDGDYYQVWIWDVKYKARV